ncbi:hypothetical protein HMSSN036_58460 [Paenibacillus macerans]|nr:hypothetical protein HMSSN036_58460 [Paenibacillus macerans]
MVDRIGNVGVFRRNPARVAGGQTADDESAGRDRLRFERRQLKIGRHFGGDDAGHVLFERHGFDGAVRDR